MFTGIPFVNDRQTGSMCLPLLYPFVSSHVYETSIMEAPSSPPTRSASHRDCRRPINRKRTRAKLLCPHCNERVSNSTFYRHKSYFYNRKLKKWMSESESKAGYDISSSNDSDDTNERGGAVSDQHGMLTIIIPYSDKICAMMVSY